MRLGVKGATDDNFRFSSRGEASSLSSKGSVLRRENKNGVGIPSVGALSPGFSTES